MRRLTAAAAAGAGSPPAGREAIGGPPGSARSRPWQATTLARWWPLIAILVAAAAIRFSTLGLQSLWYDEAFTPVHVLRASLSTTLHEMVHYENTPPLWYLLIWAWSRALGTGAVALRSVSALAGLVTVAAGWGIGAELRSRRVSIILATIIAINPLFVWYSQEARAYELYTMFAAISLLFFLRSLRAPADHRGWALSWWSLTSILALTSQYFAIFLIAPEALILLWDHRGAVSRTKTIAAVAVVAVCGVALLPLLVAQGGHGTQWIGRWALSSRLLATPSYYLLGYYGSVLGHGLLALVSLPIIAAVVLGVVELSRGRLATVEYNGLVLMLGLGLVSILLPLALALLGHDYLAPRNLVADWVPLSAALAIVLACARAGRVGLWLAVVVCAVDLAVVIATDLTPRLQRGDWNGVADVLRHSAGPERAIVTIELGSTPLEYYLPNLSLSSLSPSLAVRVREVDLVGYRPVVPGSTRPPTPAFHLVSSSDIHGLLVYRFVASSPQLLTERFLRSRTITDEHSETLVPAALAATVAN